jgi:hypothetical protein
MKPILTIGNDETERWKLPNGDYHREDGPALVCSMYKAWYIDNRLHREDGPAIEFYTGFKCWYLNGVKYERSQYIIKIRSKRLKQLLGSS